MPDPGIALAIAAPSVSPAALQVTAGLLGAASLAAFYGAFRSLARARLIEDVPTSRVRSAAQGYVELDGWAEPLPGDPVLSPLSGRLCVWYRYRVDERQRDAVSGRREWHTLEHGVSDALFRLVDASGDCVVDPEGAEVTPATHERWLGNTRRPGGPPPRREGFWWAGGRYRYREELIRSGDKLHAVGMLRTVGGPSDQTPPGEDVRVTLAAWKRDPARMRAFDADGDGRVDLAEWQAARRAAEVEVRRERAQRLARPGTAILAHPPHGGRPYLLSALCQEHLARRYRWSAAARLALFFLAGAAALAVLGLSPPG